MVNSSQAAGRSRAIQPTPPKLQRTPFVTYRVSEFSRTDKVFCAISRPLSVASTR